MRRAGILALLLLPSCVSHGRAPLKPQDLATGPYHETVTAALTGSLLYEGGCLLFRDDETTGRLMPVWPDGSVFNGTTLIFHQPGKADQLVVVGEEVTIEGQPVVPVAGGPDSGRCGAQPFFVSRVRPAN